MSSELVRTRSRTLSSRYGSLHTTLLMSDDRWDVHGCKISPHGESPFERYQEWKSRFRDRVSKRNHFTPPLFFFFWWWWWCIFSIEDERRLSSTGVNVVSHFLKFRLQQEFLSLRHYFP